MPTKTMIATRVPVKCERIHLSDSKVGRWVGVLTLAEVGAVVAGSNEGILSNLQRHDHPWGSV